MKSFFANKEQGKGKRHEINKSFNLLDKFLISMKNSVKQRNNLISTQIFVNLYKQFI